MDDMICGTCNKTWDSKKIPTPAARCPYEYDHAEEELVKRWEVTIITEWADIIVRPHATTSAEAVDFAQSLIEDSLMLRNGHMGVVRFNYSVKPLNETEGE